MQDIAVLMFKVRNNLLPSYIQDWFSSNDKTKTYNLRNSDFRIPRFNTVKYGKHSIRYFGPLLWSKLSKDLRNLRSLNAFKIEIRKVDFGFLVETCYHNCHLCISDVY